jgi:hypothetical protein
VITLFCVRPKALNVGNDAIFLGLRHLLHDAFGTLVNIVQVPAVGGEEGGLTGLTAKTIHEMNLYGHGVVVGGGNLYENGQLLINTHALAALRPPLMLFSLSYGRIYDNDHQLVRRTDAMPEPIVTALNAHAASSLARDEATLEYLRALGLDRPALGGCPSLLLAQVATPRPSLRVAAGGALLSIRHPSLMNIPLRDQARLHTTTVDIMSALDAEGFGRVRLLCHDTRDLPFACSLGDVEYILPDDIYSYLELLRCASLVVSFRLHAFLPCVSFGTAAIHISYDERSQSLVRTIGLDAWDIDFVRTRDVAAAVRDRCARLGDLAALREAAQPRWREQERVMRETVAAFAACVQAYAGNRPRAGA